MAKSRQEVEFNGQESRPGFSSDREDPKRDPLDPEGIPIDRPVSEWLDLFDPAKAVDPRATRWLLSVLRYTRPDGSPVFGPRGKSPARLRAMEAWADRLGDPSLRQVLARWLRPREDAGWLSTFPPVSSDSRPDRPLAILRPGWGAGEDLVAIDHRPLGDATFLEVAARGRTWLGPSWTSALEHPRIGRAEPTCRARDAFADCFEWSYKVGPVRVTRSVVLLRGRSMALIGQQEDGPGSATEARFDLGEGVEARAIEGSRAVLISSGRNQPTARLIPLGLPAHDRPTERGSVVLEDRRVVIRQVSEGRKRWLSALVCWGKPPTSWRPLTVAQRSKACRGDVADAVRVAWGPRDEGLVVYRSLATPALRSFLGHQSSARFLVGAFTRSGDVRPILKVDP